MANPSGPPTYVTVSTTAKVRPRCSTRTRACRAAYRTTLAPGMPNPAIAMPANATGAHGSPAIAQPTPSTTVEPANARTRSPRPRSRRPQYSEPTMAPRPPIAASHAKPSLPRSSPEGEAACWGRNTNRLGSSSSTFTNSTATATTR